ncbi:PH (Pleckstrin Homology) domain-containing protein [Amycolatopsis thermoflava]|uniref:PH (Pleckstrin Homology) domain-containing protein n=2 Tax=Amycolatopsis thermoflava TaxID=84480 RepID=A0A3N2GWK4_9PSEU|nr:PH (Pleckstrin Homology) domain-containing protein [Amycolatopsis thermoflava]
MLASDRMGTVFFAVAAIALTALSLHGLLVRPRLTADPRGLRIRTTTGKHDLHWPEVTARVRTTRRFGRDSATLEIEAGDQLFVFGWLELGTDPRDVLDALTALQP